MTDILSMDLDELTAYVIESGEPKFRAKQLYAWLHEKCVCEFDAMKNIPNTLRETLTVSCGTLFPTLLQMQESALDGTKKFLWEFADGVKAESVLMRYDYGLSACISSQSGCRMGCRFCASTVQGLNRSLTAGEMLSQVYRMRVLAGERISHVVIMGMGEPLDNYDNLLKFLKLLTDGNGQNLSGRNITVSTCGLTDKIEQLGEEHLAITLAVSLHAATQEKREILMPIAKKYPLRELILACKDYFEKTGRRVTFEYALIAGENDQLQDVNDLAALLQGMAAHVNLIPVNPAREEMKAPKRQAVYAFQKELERKGITATVRRTLGADIDGACGQLAAKNRI